MSRIPAQRLRLPSAAARTVPSPAPSVAVRRQALLLAAANVVVGASFAFAEWGPGTSVLLLRQLAPLPVWGVAHLSVAVLIVFHRELAAHTLAAVLWLMWAGGAVAGLLSVPTIAPGGLLVLAGVVVVLAGQHVNAMSWRLHGNREARSRRGG